MGLVLGKKEQLLGRVRDGILKSKKSQNVLYGQCKEKKYASLWLTQLPLKINRLHGLIMFTCQLACLTLNPVLHMDKVLSVAQISLCTEFRLNIGWMVVGSAILWSFSISSFAFFSDEIIILIVFKKGVAINKTLPGGKVGCLLGESNP